MSVGPLVGEICLTFLFAGFLLHKYGDWGRHHLLVTTNVFIAWYFSFIIIFVLPVDVSNTAYKQCLHDQGSHLTTTSTTVAAPLSSSTSSTTDNSTLASENGTTFAPLKTTIPSADLEPTLKCLAPWSIVPDGVLPTLWRVVYWTSQVLTWLILPLMQSYSTAGDFSVSGKIKTALVENAIYYGTYLLIFGVLLLYVALKPDIHLDGSKLKVICITASNTWGLCLLVLLLGHGLVEIPRSLWQRSLRGRSLLYCYFRAAKLASERCEAEESLDDVMEEIMQVSSTISPSSPLQKYMDIIFEKCPEDKKAAYSRLTKRLEEHPLSGAPSEKTLVRLHRQIIRSLQTYHRTQCQWASLVESALAWEDVARNELSHERTFKHRFPPRRSAFVRAIFTPTIEWYWRCVLQVWVLRALTVTLALFSAMVVWSEMTFFTRSPTLSLFAVFFNLAKASHNYLLIEVGSIVTIAYLCICAYSTVFKIRVFNYYHLASYHQTDEYSLIFCGMMLCRLTPPLCLNYLGMIHLDSHVTKSADILETSYTKIMGHMDVISFISDGFNVYFPMGIFLLCFATYFNLGARLLHFVGFEQFLGPDDLTLDLVEEGRELIRREKNKRQRLEDGDQRRKRTYNTKYSATGSRGRRSNVPSETGLLQTPMEENVRTELLQDVEPVDYTEPDRRLEDPLDFRLDSSLSGGDQSYNRVIWNKGGRPPSGLFDDV